MSDDTATTLALTDDELEAFREACGAFAAKRTPAPRGVAYLHPMMFNNWRISVGNDWAVDDSYCYDGFARALVAFQSWNPEADPEPTGWKRHPQSGRRRPDGNAAEEYIDP